MAQIDLEKFNRLEKGKHTLHEKVLATYSTFEINGDRYLQIDTYGSNSREIQGKVSQSLQIDSKTAEYLVNLIIREFDLKY